MAINFHRTGFQYAKDDQQNEGRIFENISFKNSAKNFFKGVLKS
jgi:hypothetical protein